MNSNEPFGFLLYVTVRTLVSSAKSQGISEELLVVMGWRDQQWSLLDQVAARNLQKGLVTFDLVEIFDRFYTQLLLTYKWF